MQQFRGLVGWCGFILATAGAVQACGDSSNDGASSSDGAGAGGALGEAGAPAPGSGGSDASLGGAQAGGVSQAEAGAPGSAGAGASAEGGSNGSGGTGAGNCFIAWTGAETGDAGCPRLHVCQKNFLSLNLDDPLPDPLKSIQLVYSPQSELTLGTFVATGLDAVNSNVQTDANVMYAPLYDQDNMLTGGTSMTVTLTELVLSTDPNDPCAGTAHGTLDTALPQKTPQEGANTLTLHAEF